MISDEVASNRRRSVVSLASRRSSRQSHDDGAAEAFLEISQLYRLREISNRIAHEKAKRKSFCKYNQVRMVRIRLLGTKDKAPLAKNLTPTSDNGYGCEIGRDFSNLRVNGGWEGDDTEVDPKCNMYPAISLTVPLQRINKGMGSISMGKSKHSMRKNSWQDFGSESSSLNEGASRDTVHKSQSKKWAVIAKHYRLGHLSRRGEPKDREFRCNAFPLTQEDTPGSIKGNRTEGAKPDGRNQERLPRLVTTTRSICSSLGCGGGESRALKDATEEQGNNPGHHVAWKTSSEMKQVGFTDENKRRQSLYQTRMTIKLTNSRNPASDNQQKKMNVDVKNVSESRFSTCGKSKRRLSDEFRKLQSCRYLRLYKMK